jgi:protein-L-isoaspartate O-methyltransferase
MQPERMPAESVTWQQPAARLAASILHPQSRWRDAVTATPRHLLVPRWFEWDDDGQAWELRDGLADEAAWLAAAYSRRTLVTRAGPVHADHASPGQRHLGWPSSSSTSPALVIAMYRLARIYDGADVLDVGTGSGYGAALLTRRLGAARVTTIDVDPYLTRVAGERLAAIGARPAILTVDATAVIPGSYDRIIPMVSAPAIPASWLAALRPGGRLVFSLARTSALITADKAPDGGARGQVEWEPVTFMAARHGPGCPARLDAMLQGVRDAEGEHVSLGRYPALCVTWGQELDAMLEVTAPGIEHHYECDEDTGTETAWMLHPDGSWARATGTQNSRPVVHQSGPRRLWDILDDIRHRWVLDGTLPLRGAAAAIDPDGTCHLSQGTWHATIRPHPRQETPASKEDGAAIP